MVATVLHAATGCAFAFYTIFFIIIIMLLCIYIIITIIIRIVSIIIFYYIENHHETMPRRRLLSPPPPKAFLSYVPNRRNICTTKWQVHNTVFHEKFNHNAGLGGNEFNSWTSLKCTHTKRT